MFYWGGHVALGLWTEEIVNAAAINTTAAQQPAVAATPAGTGAYLFDGGDRLETTATGVASVLGHTLIFGIFRTTQVPADYGLLFGSLGASFFAYINDDNTFRVDAYDDTATSVSDGALNDDAWHSFMAVLTDSTRNNQLYIDGVLQATSDTGTSGATDLQFAYQFGSFDGTFVGSYIGRGGLCGIAQRTTSFSAGTLSNLAASLAGLIG
jgi:hypothetical protein